MNIKKSMIQNLNKIITKFEYNIDADIVKISRFKNKTFNEYEILYKQIFSSSYNITYE
jgi:hypothetical protein